MLCIYHKQRKSAAKLKSDVGQFIIHFILLFFLDQSTSYPRSCLKNFKMAHSIGNWKG